MVAYKNHLPEKLQQAVKLYHKLLDYSIIVLQGAYIGTLGLMECKKHVLYVIRKR